MANWFCSVFNVVCVVNVCPCCRSELIDSKNSYQIVNTSFYSCSRNITCLKICCFSIPFSFFCGDYCPLLNAKKLIQGECLFTNPHCEGAFTWRAVKSIIYGIQNNTPDNKTYVYNLTICMVGQMVKCPCTTNTCSISLESSAFLLKPIPIFARLVINLSSLISFWSATLCFPCYMLQLILLQLQSQLWECLNPFSPDPTPLT